MPNRKTPRPARKAKHERSIAEIRDSLPLLKKQNGEITLRMDALADAIKARGATKAK